MKEKNIFETPKEVFEAQINDLFSKKEQSERNKLIQVMSIVLNTNSKSKDLVDLYDCLEIDNFIKVISLFERRTVKFPSKEEVKESILLSVIFYYREVLGYDWPAIKGIVPFEYSSISYASKIKKLNRSIFDNIKEVLKENE
jgi:hypothetical protein